MCNFRTLKCYFQALIKNAKTSSIHFQIPQINPQISLHFPRSSQESQCESAARRKVVLRVHEQATESGEQAGAFAGERSQFAVGNRGGIGLPCSELGSAEADWFDAVELVEYGLWGVLLVWWAGLEDIGDFWYWLLQYLGLFWKLWCLGSELSIKEYKIFVVSVTQVQDKWKQQTRAAVW